MSNSEAFEILQQRCEKMEQHIQEQDTEIYRLSKRVDKLVNALQVQKLQIEALAQGGGGADTMPADEKPPHY